MKLRVEVVKVKSECEKSFKEIFFLHFPMVKVAKGKSGASRRLYCPVTAVLVQYCFLLPFRDNCIVCKAKQPPRDSIQGIHVIYCPISSPCLSFSRFFTCRKTDL